MASWINALRADEQAELRKLWLLIHSSKEELRDLRNREAVIRDRAIKRLARAVDKATVSA